MCKCGKNYKVRYLLLYRFMMGLGLYFLYNNVIAYVHRFWHVWARYGTFLTKIAAAFFFRQEKSWQSPLSLGPFAWRLVPGVVFIFLFRSYLFDWLISVANQCCDNDFCGSGSGSYFGKVFVPVPIPVPDPDLFNSVFQQQNLAFSMLEAALFSKFFMFLTFILPFMSSSPNPVPEPVSECITVLVPLRQKVAVPVSASFPQHCRKCQPWVISGEPFIIINC
jgi:hypothetical protein